MNWVVFLNASMALKECKSYCCKSKFPDFSSPAIIAFQNKYSIQFKLVHFQPKIYLICTLSLKLHNKNSHVSNKQAALLNEFLPSLLAFF